MSELFIGVVSHRGSRFADAQSDEGAAAQLSKQWHLLGRTCVVHVNVEDLLEESGIRVTENLVRNSPAEELRIERQWAGFLGQRQGSRWWAVHAARWSKYWLDRVKGPDKAAATRLLNIELSHLDLMRRAVASGAAHALILEDDAGCANAEDLALGLTGLMDQSTSLDFANLSHSFSMSDLGISHLLTPTDGQVWTGTDLRIIYTAKRPVTNTVCAILYSTPFLERLLAVFDRLAVDPVAPIDWKLNRALMALADEGGLAPDGCLWVEPAPIVQRSMTL